MALPPPPPRSDSAHLPLPRIICAAAALRAQRAAFTNPPRTWLESEDPCGGVPQCGRQAESECAWAGVTCNGSRIVELRLPCLRGYCFSLEGQLAPGLGQATALTVIDLRGNSLGECMHEGASERRRQL